MKKGLLQRASKNGWEEIRLVPLPIKEEPVTDQASDNDLIRQSVLQSAPTKAMLFIRAEEIDPNTQQQQQTPPPPSTTTARKVQSMISVRKDYSYKYTVAKAKAPLDPPPPPFSSPASKENCLGISHNVSKSYSEPQLARVELKSKSLNVKPLAPLSRKHPLRMSHYGRPKEVTNRSSKPNISILERHDYHSSKVIKIDGKIRDESEPGDGDSSYDDENRTLACAIDKSQSRRAAAAVQKSSSANPSFSSVDFSKPFSSSSSSSAAIDAVAAAAVASSPSTSSSIENLKSNTVPMPIRCSDIKLEAVEDTTQNDLSTRCERDKLKVIVANDETPAVVRQECESPPASGSLRQPTLSTESKDSQNINKINNKINIIFQLNDNTKSLRKNIILHRRTPKKMVQKITIKETNNNNNNSSTSSGGTKSQSTDCDTTTTLVPDNKILCTIETQTEEVEQKHSWAMNMSLSNPLTEESTEHLFFEKGIMISVQSKTVSFFQLDRLSSLLKKGETDFRLIDRCSRSSLDVQVDGDNKFQRLCYNDLNTLPIYVEMRAKQKELANPDMCPIAFLYCNIYYLDPNRAQLSSVHLDTVKSVVEDIRYTTVPNSSYFIMSWHENALDTKGSVSGIVKYKLTPNLVLAKLASIRPFPKLNYRIKQMYCGKDLQLVTIGDTQVSIFNYDSGDLLISLDLMKNYGINLTSFTYEGSYLFLVYLADVENDASSSRRLIVIGVHKYDNNGFKVIQSIPVNVGRNESIVSRSITSSNHLVVTFSNGSSIMMYLNNFQDVHFGCSSRGSVLFAANDYMLATSDENKKNVSLCHFTEFFLNA